MASIRPAFVADALAMGPNMREIDKREAELLTGKAPVEALINQVSISQKAWTGMAEGQIVCMFGVSKPGVLSPDVMPWLAGTDLILKHSREFLRRNKEFLPVMLEGARTAYGMVLAENTAAITWLRWLGFAVHKKAPVTYQGATLYKFEMKVR